jgi:hypothetical protein
MWRSKNDLHITHRLDDYEQFFHLSAAKSCPNYRDQLRELLVEVAHVQIEVLLPV